MFSNEFLTDFKILDFTLIKWLHLEPFIVKMLNPQSNGVAIQKGNTFNVPCLELVDDKLSEPEKKGFSTDLFADAAIDFR